MKATPKNIKIGDRVKLETYLPVFQGFYGTIFEDADGENERQELTYLLQDFVSEESAETLAELCLCNDGIYETNYRAYEAEYCERMTDCIEAKLLSLNRLKGLESIKMQSVYYPREYNFINNSVNIELQISDGQAFCNSLLKIINEDLDSFKDYIESRYTSCSGFMSGYSNNPADWMREIAEGPDALDGHKAGALLDFVLYRQDYKEFNLYEDTERPYMSDFMELKIDKENIQNEELQGLFTDIERGNKEIKDYQKLQTIPDFAKQNQEKGWYKNKQKLYKKIIEIMVEGTD